MLIGLIGTLYNRLESLQIKDNSFYTVKNETTGIVLYNRKAIDVLKGQYLKEFTSNTEEEKNNIDKIIIDYLSSKSKADKSRNIEYQENKKNLKNDKNDNFDNSDNLYNVNNVNISYINENYILKELHNETIKNLQNQIEILKCQLEKETATNEKLVDTIRLREQKDTVVEQQKLFQLQNDVKFIADTGENQEEIKEKRRTGGVGQRFKKIYLRR